MAKKVRNILYLIIKINVSSKLILRIYKKFFIIIFILSLLSLPLIYNFNLNIYLFIIILTLLGGIISFYILFNANIINSALIAFF